NRSPWRVVARYRQIVFDSQKTRPSSLIVGTRPFGFIARYSGSRLPPNGPPRSTRSYSMPSSAQHQSTFCTLDEVVRPQIFSITTPPARFARMEPQFLTRRNSCPGLISVYVSCDWNLNIRRPGRNEEMSDELARVPVDRCAAPLYRGGGGEPTGSGGDRLLEGGGYMRQAGSGCPSRLQCRGECETGCRAKGLLERSQPGSAPTPLATTS